MEGKFLDRGLSPWGTAETLVVVDLSDKGSIRALEKSVKKSTGLNWMVTDTTGVSLINWKLLLPIRGGKIEIEAQSNRDRPTQIYGFQIGSPELFMQALKQIEAKR